MRDRTSSLDGFAFRPVFDAASNAMLLIDGDQRLVAGNQAAARLLRHNAGNLDGHPLAAIAGISAAALPARWRQIMADGSGTLDLRTADDLLIQASLHIVGPVVEDIHLVVVAAAQHPHSARPLTSRQEDTLRLLCDGATNQQIAIALGISEPTVQKHISSIKGRLGATTRAQVVAIALQRRDLALRVGRARLYVHQAIRTDAGEIADTRLVYISHETQRQQPQIIAFLGQAMSEWYPDYPASDLFAILVEAIETGDLQRTEQVAFRPPWQPSGYAVGGVAAPIGADCAVFVSDSPLGG